MREIVVNWAFVYLGALRISARLNVLLNRGWNTASAALVASMTVAFISRRIKIAKKVKCPLQIVL